MTCNACGYELNNEDRFCSRCGRKVSEDPDRIVTLTEYFDTAAARLKPFREKLAAWGCSLEPKLQTLWSLLKQCPVSVNLLAAALQALAVFLWFGDILTTSVLGYSQDFSMHDLCNGVEFISYFSAVLLLAGALFSACPGLLPDARIFKKVNIPMAATAWAFAWYLIGIFGASEQVGDYSRYGAEINLTTGGWLLGIVCIIAFVLLLREKWQHKTASNTNC